MSEILLRNAVAILTLLTLASGLYFAFVRFGLKRERATFLRISIDTMIVSNAKPAALVQLSVHLENKGDTRINARRLEDLDAPAKFLYDDTWDQCEHAGTLKVRAIPPRGSAWILDWYGLSAMPVTNQRCTAADKPNHVGPRAGDLEQINYLSEYLDPTVNYRDADFWLEPHETYDQTVPLWLPPGEYAAKAYFLGRQTKHGEEEYWTNMLIFHVPATDTADKGTSCIAPAVV
jgi:hypothetical protein